MKINSTLQDLNGRLLEIQNFQQSFPTISDFIGGRIESFSKNNRVYIQILQEKAMKLLDAHCEKNDVEEVAEKGTYKFAKKVTEVGEIMQPVFIDDEHAKKYKEEWDSLMKSSCTIIL